jgi:hypothetical protein
VARMQLFNQNIGVGRSSGFGQARMTSDGAQYMAQYAMAASIEGRLMGCHFGTLTAPLATAATTAITTLLPQAWVRIPTGTTIIPVSANVLMEVAGATTQGEISICTCTVDPGDGTGAAGTKQPISLNTSAPVTSNCTTRQLATGNITAETGLLELKRFSFVAAAVNLDFTWNAAGNLLFPILKGPAGFLIYIGGNAVNFFAQMQWIELPSTAIS